MKLLWPTKTERQKRGIWDGHGSTGMDFPSSEAALMTIAFLTFAVFLIKLVLVTMNTPFRLFAKKKQYSHSSLFKYQNVSMHFFQQVINTLKSKHYSFNSFGTMNAAQANPPVKIIKKNRNARKISFSEDDLTGFADILTATESYKDAK